MLNSKVRLIFREILGWYLNKFPLRDGKAYLYDKLNPIMVPQERFMGARFDKGFSLKLDLWDREQRKVYFYGHYHERYETKLIRRLLDVGEVFWDIGASIGYFSMVAFEPGKIASERLLDNISLNHFTNIQAYNLAVTESEGQAVLFLSHRKKCARLPLIGNF